jgi:hypothetical protein
MEIAIAIGLGIFAIVFIIGWLMFVYEHPIIATILALLMME